MENRELWFTDYRDLNDPSEYLLSLKILNQIVEDFAKCSHQKDLWHIFNQEYPKTKENDHVYTFSFCESCDYLPAWRWYGDNGKGFSIGFNQDYFLPSASKINGDEGSAISIKIYYEQNEFAALLNKFLKITDKLYKKYTDSKYHISKEQLSEILVVVLSSSLMEFMPCFKHPGYKYEREHRLYEREFIADGKSYPDRIADEHKFPDNNGKRRLKSNQFKHADICEIWVGPCMDFKSAETDIKSILSASGYDAKLIKIRQSEMPYRI